ncbi:NAD(P)/FAD-dependent oxidoreductase [Aquabacterium sp.]|uniref:NAD(P)/FAD-dependent oxidoreductase n=1 Tax=Aquabacterium sp. TaxID=1872578 RepID=UPI002C06ECF4|nr:FAD-binding oxidoreductase [Aquabacterium sp.]HSW06397.1 FAD-binding oxidoreductase [Aquabacterium sp.]
MSSYYEATIPPRAPAQPLHGAIDAEVCIVGAGFAGLATALGLVERGIRDVVVLEAQRVGFGASGRNGGFVFGGYSLDNADLLAQLGPQRAKACYGLTRSAVDLIRRRVQAHAIDCDLVEGGALLANWFDDESLLLKQQRLMADHFGVQWQLIRKAELEAHVRSDRYFGALLEPDAFHFHPLKYALGEARAVQAGGGRIQEASPVTSISRAGTGFSVSTAQGSVAARHVVVAGGGYLQGLVPAIERAMLPIATYVMVTEPLGALQRELVPSRAAIYDTRFAFDYYRALADTRLLWGGRINVRDRRPEDIAEFLKRDMLRVYPRLADAKVEFAWSGMMSYARHKMPQIGRLTGRDGAGDAAGAWYALSFGGHGVAPTTVAGEVLAAAIAEGQPIPDGFQPYGLPRTFGPLGLAAAQATYAWFELKDWARSI